MMPGDAGEAIGSLVKEDPSPPGLRDVFLSFLWLGATAYGGPAMVPQIHSMAVTRRGWLQDGDFRNGIALCQTIPGATAIQMAGYVGFRIRAIPGAIAAYLGFGLPAFLIVMVLSALYVQASGMPLAVVLLQGLRAVVVAIVVYASLGFARTAITGWRAATIAVAAFILFLAGLHPLLVIGIAAILGVILLPQESPPPGTGDGKAATGHGWPYLALLLATGAGFVVLWFLSPLLFEIAWVFFRVDLLAFGGGLAALPVMYYEAVTVHGWVTPQAFLDGVAIGQITPGPIVITATFLGYLVAGIPGALVATLAIFTPSFLVVVGMIPYFDRIRSSPRLINGLTGIVCSFTGLLFTVAIRFALEVDWTLALAILAIAAFVALVKGIGVQWVVAAGVVVSILAAPFL